ncbi:MAG TPA: response regulator transcription factor [Verrucomicrobiae bacterium]|jgi:DNA-binding NarL/FixJ family response regulator|nr:response regulator transcription factor [Verrucomicrobiae bacterium]
MKKHIKVFIVDDHPLVRKGVAVCLSRHKDMEIVGETGDAREVLSMATELQPDVIMMDIGMPHMSGTTVTALLRRELPHIRVLVLSIHETPEYVQQAMHAGARGYVLKGIPCADLICAVETVYRGELYFKSEMIQSFREMALRDGQDSDAPRLTEREREVLIQVAEGGSNKDIAAKLGIAVRTVETHRENLMQKLKIRSAAGLARFAVARQLVPAQPDNASLAPSVLV